MDIIHALGRASKCGGRGAHPRTRPRPAVRSVPAPPIYPVHARRAPGGSRCCIIKPPLAVGLGFLGGPTAAPAGVTRRLLLPLPHRRRHHTRASRAEPPGPTTTANATHTHTSPAPPTNHRDRRRADRRVAIRVHPTRMRRTPQLLHTASLSCSPSRSIATCGPSRDSSEVSGALSVIYSPATPLCDTD